MINAKISAALKGNKNAAGKRIGKAAKGLASGMVVGGAIDAGRSAFKASRAISAGNKLMGAKASKAVSRSLIKKAVVRGVAGGSVPGLAITAGLMAAGAAKKRYDYNKSVAGRTKSAIKEIKAAVKKAAARVKSKIKNGP